MAKMIQNEAKNKVHKNTMNYSDIEFGRPSFALLDLINNVMS